MSKLDMTITEPLISEIAEYINVVDANTPAAATNAQFCAVKKLL